MALHLNIEDLLSARTVESDRIEYKEGWNPDAIYRSICAFANDFENLGGGYILISVEENVITKTAKRPVKGLSTAQIGAIQQDMIGYNNLMKPYYAPRLFVEAVDDQQIIVLWVIAGSERPYEVPESVIAKHKLWKYFIRKYASSIEAKGADKEELISLTNQIPFDDRSNRQAGVENISMLLVKDYLIKVKSRLAEQVGKMSDRELLGQMELISGPNEHVFPRNVALMLFTEQPERFFPYTQVEIVEFPEGDAGPYTELEPITGPITLQISRTLAILKDKLVREKVIKPANKPESIRYTSYPYQAIEEIVVNAFYHRDYQQREPIEIRIYPNAIVFLNQGGPDRSIRLEAFARGAVCSRRYRNRRLGEFLKELELTEGRATGIPTILRALKANGSPPPRFYVDDDRTLFEVELFIHPAFKVSAPVTLELKAVRWDLQGIDSLIELLLEKTAGGIAGGIADDQAENSQITEYQAELILGKLDNNQIGAIAGGIAGGIAEKTITLLMDTMIAKSRKELLTGLSLVNNANNFETYLQPLVAINWLTMTIPDKPTSPKQKYQTTLKGQLVLNILKQSGIKNLESGKSKNR